MKKIGTMFVMMFLVLGLMTFVAATDDLEIEDAGQKPGSFFYGFDKAMDNFKVSMTFNQERKSDRAMQVAEERLAEYEQLILENDTKGAEKALEAYNRYIEKSEKAMKKIDSYEDSEKGLRSSAKILERTESHQEKLDEIYTRILEKRGENMTEEELEKLNSLFEKISEKSLEISEKALERKNTFKTKHKILSEMSDSEIEEFEDEIESEEGIKELRMERDLRNEDRFERATMVRQRNVERFESFIENRNLTEEQTLKIRERIEEQQSNFNEFKIKREGLRDKIREKDFNDETEEENETESEIDEDENETEELQNETA